MKTTELKIKLGKTVLAMTLTINENNGFDLIISETGTSLVSGIIKEGKVYMLDVNPVAELFKDQLKEMIKKNSK